MKREVRAILQSKSFLFHFLPTFVVFIAFLSVTVWAYNSALNSLQREESRVIERRVLDTQNAIERRLSTYQEILRGGAGFFAASDQVTQNEWAEYIARFELQERYPGIQGIGFSKALAPWEVRGHEEWVRQQGFENYAVTPTDDRSIYTAITYLEPLDKRNRKALGFDMFTEPIRRAAMEQARDTGQIVFSDKVTLVQEIDEDKQAGFLVYMPIYAMMASVDTVEKRRESLRGYVYAPFRAGDLFEGIFLREPERVGFRIYVNDKKPENALYENAAYSKLAASEGVLLHSSVLDMNGANWIIDYRFAPTIVADTFRIRPISTLAAGMALSVLTAGLVLALLVARTRSLAALKEREVQTAKDDLLSLASHQLRTPATGVKQYIGMVLEGYAGSLKDDQRMYLEKAFESNERQLHIINELLYVAKADAGRIVLAKRDIRINELIKDIVAEQKHIAKEKNISVKVKLPSRERLVYADKHCLRMAVENLLNNAIKYTPDDGKVRISVAHENDKTLISIKDTGVGISDEDKDRLFNRFSRIPNTLSTQTSGSGIGLYLAKNLIQMHDGDITVESTEGKGTTFTICMPHGK